MTTKKPHHASQLDDQQTDPNASDQPLNDSESPNHSSDARSQKLISSSCEDVLSHDHGYVVVGKIGRSHGLQGMVFIQSFTEPKENLFSYDPLFLGNKDKICFSRYQSHAKQMIAQIKGTTDCDQAKRLVNKLIYLHTDQLPKLPDGQYYWHELTGLRVLSQHGADYGTVDYIYAGGQFPIMVVKSSAHGKNTELLIPYESSVVTRVDQEARTIHVDWEVD